MQNLQSFLSTPDSTLKIIIFCWMSSLFQGLDYDKYFWSSLSKRVSYSSMVELCSYLIPITAKLTHKGHVFQCFPSDFFYFDMKESKQGIQLSLFQNWDRIDSDGMSINKYSIQYPYLRFKEKL